jgi:inward rectifier potassium channel
VHPIQYATPLIGNTRDDLAKLSAELLILIHGFVDTFSQVVHSRYSYRHDDMIWGAKFIPAFKVDPHGDLVVEVNRIDELKLIG